MTDFNFASNYHMRGNTMRLSAERIAESPFRTEEAFIAHLLTTVGTSPFDQDKDFNAFANNLQMHFRLVKARAQQHEFRRSVLDAQGRQCALCDIGLPAVLDAAHLIPKEHDGTDDHRNGLVLCALHHRMFDTNFFKIDPSDLSVHASENYSLADLRISRASIGHLRSRPHNEALRWRWEH
jgi:hypothetical protein